MARFDFTSEKSYYDDLMGGNNPKANSEIAIEYLTEIHDQPFKPYSSEQLQLLADDIKLNGLMSPLIVMQVPGTVYYEIIAGRNRYNACLLLNMQSVPCIVKTNLSNAQRNLILVNSNLMQRQMLLPSERARAYRMQLDAYKELGVKVDFDGSQANVYKYLRLNNLYDQLLYMVDRGEILFTIGYELSAMSNIAQHAIYDYLSDYPNVRLNDRLLATLKSRDDAGELNNSEDISDTIASGGKATSQSLKPKTKLTINLKQFKSELSTANPDILLKVIISNEYDILRMYQEEQE